MKSCICFITDANYLLPTLVSASQAASHADGAVDVIAILVTDNETVPEMCRPVFEVNMVRLIDRPTAILDGQHIMHARLRIDCLLPGEYSDVLYLDSDVQITSSLKPLLSAPIDETAILAVPDPMSLIIDHDRRLSEDLRRYFSSIGLPPSRMRSYFNSGVMRASRSAWKRVGSDALEASSRSGEGLRFPDQDLLNIVGGNSHRAISMRWNFPAFFLQAGLERYIPPNVIHFMSNPRPWQGPFMPWGMAGYRPYRDAVAAFPELRGNIQKITPQRFIRMGLQQIWKRVFEAPIWRSDAVKERLMQQEALSYV